MVDYGPRNRSSRSEYSDVIGPSPAPPPLTRYFKTKLMPEGLKKKNSTAPSYVRVWMTNPTPNFEYLLNDKMILFAF